MISFSGVTQTPGIYPVPVLQFYSNYGFENPAASSSYEQFDLRFLNKSYTGLLRNVGLLFLDLYYSPEEKPHSFGLVLHSEYETDLLKRTRGYLRYAWETSLAEELYFSAGASLGLFNYFVKATASSAGASLSVPDGNIGIWLSGNSFNAGISLNQIFSSSVKPVQTIIILSRYLTFTADYRFDFSLRNSLLLSAKVVTPQHNYWDLQAAAIFSLLNNFNFGLMYYYLRGAGFTLGLKNFTINRINGDINLAYLKASLLTPSYIHNLKNDRIEIFIRLFISDKEKQRPVSGLF